MLTFHEAILFSKAAYGDEEGHRAVLEGLGWRLTFDSSSVELETGLRGNTKLGYRGLCFTKMSTRGIPTVVIAHRGTRPDNHNNTASNSEIVGGAIPKESQVALVFTEYCASKIEGPNGLIPHTYHIGHSLGGVHAFFCAYNTKQFAMGVDNPGIWGALKKLSFDPGQNQIDKHVSLLSHSNLVNNHGGRYGKVYQLMGEIGSSGSRLHTHKLDFLLERTPKDHEGDPFDPAFVLPEGFKAIPRRIMGSRRSPDLMANRIIHPTVTSHLNQGDGETYWRMNSELAFDKDENPELVSSTRWLVHYCCWGKGNGHSVIVVEGVAVERGHAKSFVGCYDLTFDPRRADKKVTINIREEDHHVFAQYYDPKKTASFESYGEDRQDVIQMIASIKRDQVADNIEYEKWSGGIFRGAPDVIRDNCCSWVIRKLAVANITLHTPVMLVAAPYKPKAHGVKEDQRREERNGGASGRTSQLKDSPLNRSGPANGKGVNTEEASTARQAPPDGSGGKACFIL